MSSSFLDPTAPQGAERRREPRANIDLPITIALPDGEHEARLRDVSKGGVCFYLDRRIPEMTMLRLELNLPTEAGELPQRVSGAGVVVRCLALSPQVDHYEIAVFLNDITESNRERLEEYVMSVKG
jgi:hypothetical protein